jgi:hypothetical protein
MRIDFLLVFLLGMGWKGVESSKGNGGSSLSKAMASLKGSLFSMTCRADEEELYSDWSICVWPHGDLRKLVTRFVRDSREKDCKMPPRQLVRVALKSLKESSYKHHPLYKKIPASECGFCGRKAQCCRKSRSFLTQSFRSDYCEDTSPPCETEPIDQEMKTALERQYPGMEIPLGSCDYSPYVRKEVERLHEDVSFNYIKPLFCQILGTTNPSLSCVKEDGVCRCCCVGFEYQDGACVSVDQEEDPECSDDSW